MPKRTRLSVCRRKQRYATEEAAVAAAALDGLDLRPYRCERCHSVHLTSRRKGKRRSRPTEMDAKLAE